MSCKYDSAHLLLNSPKLSLQFPCKQVGRILFFILNKLLCIWSLDLFSSPNNLFCADNERRIYILINPLELKELRTYKYDGREVFCTAVHRNCRQFICQEPVWRCRRACTVSPVNLISFSLSQISTGIVRCLHQPKSRSPVCTAFSTLH